MRISAVRWPALLILKIAPLFATMAGCEPKPAAAPHAELPYAGQTVEVAAPQDLELRELWQPILQEWQAVTGATVSWSEYDSSHQPWKHNSLAGQSSAGRVVVLPLADLPEADAAGILRPVPPATQERIDQKDIFLGLKESTLSRDKKLIAAPVSAPPLLCYYRTDLLSAAGRKPPRTWDEYQKLVEELDQWAPQLTAWEPCGPEFRASLLLARSAAYCKHSQNYSLWFDIQTGEPLFDTPGFERALETAQATWKKMPADIWTATPAACRQALLDGRAALALTWEPSATYPKPPPATPGIRERQEPLPIGVAALPGAASVYQRDAKRWETMPDDSPNQPGFVGFTGLALAVTAKNETDAAWSLFEALVRQISQAFAERPRSPCRESETGLPLFGADGSISPDTAGMAIDATAAMLRQTHVACDLAVPQARTIREIISTELAAMQNGTASPREVLTAINSKIAAATQPDRESLRNAYRRSLGLSPLK